MPPNTQHPNHATDLPAEHQEQERAFRHDIELHETVGRRTQEYRDSAATVSPALGAIVLGRGLTPELVASQLTEHGVVDTVPTFALQQTDSTRTGTFAHFNEFTNRSGDGKRSTSTEHKGLVQLDEFLEEFGKSVGESKTSELDDMGAKAASIREALSFVGSSEFLIAVKGLGDYWKSFLDEDDKRMICAVTEIGKLPRYEKKKQVKSDEFVRKKILASFTPDETAKYGSRIVTTLGDLRGDSKDHKVVLLDDWTISGQQMRDEYAEVAKTVQGRDIINQGHVEINLLAASAGRIEQGLLLDPTRPSRGSIAVKAFFQAHEAVTTNSEIGTHLSGLHSTVNYEFGWPIRAMHQAASEIGIALPVPGLASISRNYKIRPPKPRKTRRDI